MAQGPGVVTARRDARVIEEEIERRRTELTVLAAELHRRWQELTDVRLQMRRHSLRFAGSAFAVGAVVAGTFALGQWRTRRRDNLVARGERLRDAVGRIIERPERVAAEPTTTQRIIGSAGSGAAAFLIKAALERVAHTRGRADHRA